MHTEQWCTCELYPWKSTQDRNRVNLLPGAMSNLTYRGEVISYLPPSIYMIYRPNNNHSFTIKCRVNFFHRFGNMRVVRKARVQQQEGQQTVQREKIFSLSDGTQWPNNLVMKKEGSGTRYWLLRVKQRYSDNSLENWGWPLRHWPR